MAEARKARCVLADVRWRWTLKARCVLADVRWRWTLKILWGAARTRHHRHLVTIDGVFHVPGKQLAQMPYDPAFGKACQAPRGSLSVPVSLSTGPTLDQNLTPFSHSPAVQLRAPCEHRRPASPVR